MLSPEIIQVEGVRVLTTRQLAEAYETDVETLKNNFSYNRKRYIAGKHYIAIEGAELKEFKARYEIHTNLKFARILYLWTEKGALLHAKSLNTDKAWEVYDYLVDFYFRAKEEHEEPQLPKVVPAKKELPKLPKQSRTVPEMRNPIMLFHILLDMADEKGFHVSSFSFQYTDSMLHADRIGIRKNVTVEKAVYELAIELVHALVHYDGGNLIENPLSKFYTAHAERMACMLIQTLDRKIDYLKARS